MPIPAGKARAARNALLDLLEALKGKDLTKLGPNRLANDNLPAGERPVPGRKDNVRALPKSTDGPEWEEALRHAAEEIPEWCQSFSIDVEP